ncbi:MAG: hypothetical protein ACRD0P_00110 [Stackebrandtia sp.]
MTEGWLSPGPHGFRTRAPWVWSILLGLYGLGVAAVGAVSARTAAATDAATAGPTAVGLFGLAAVVVLGAGGVLRHAVPAGKVRMRVAGLRRLTHWLIAGGYATIAVAGLSVFVRLLPGDEQRMGQLPLVAVAALMPFVMFFSFGTHCRRTVTALSTTAAGHDHA